MKANISIDQSGVYYTQEWDIKIEIDCKSVYELKQIISKLKEITETLRGEKK